MRLRPVLHPALFTAIIRGLAMVAFAIVPNLEALEAEPHLLDRVFAQIRLVDNTSAGSSE